MSRTDRKAALTRLTKARERLANADVFDKHQANQEVHEAEKNVLLGRARGWDYTDPNDR